MRLTGFLERQRRITARLCLVRVLQRKKQGRIQSVPVSFASRYWIMASLTIWFLLMPEALL